MEISVTKESSQTTGASKTSSRSAKPSSSSPSPSSLSLSGRAGLRVLMHRDLITCRFIRSFPRSWLKKYWTRLGRESNKHRLASSSPLHWSSSPFSLSSSHFSSCSSSGPSHFLRLPVSRLFSSALKDRDRERDQPGAVSSQSLNGNLGFLSAPGMTVGQWGHNTQSTAAHTTSATVASASSLSQSLRHNSSSG